MKPLNLTTWLAVGAIGVGGSLAVAQNAGMDDAATQDRASQPQQTQQQNQQSSPWAAQAGQNAQASKTLSGTIVSLEAYLRGGESAAQAQAALDAGAMARMSTSNQTTALLTDQGEVYIILNQPAQAQAQTDRFSQTQDAMGHGAQAAADDGMATQARADGDPDVDMDSQAGAQADVQADAQAAIDETGAQARNDAEQSLSDILGQDQDDQRADAAGVAADSQAGVYGMAEPDAAGRNALSIGQQVTLTGRVLARSGIQGVYVVDVQQSPATGAQAAPAQNESSDLLSE